MVVRKKKVAEKGVSRDISDFEEFDTYNDTHEEYLDDDELLSFEEDDTYNDFETGIDDNARIQRLWLDSDPYVNKIYLIITNQQVIKKKIKDRNGDEYTKTLIRQIKGTEPLANSEGIAQIMGYVKANFAGDIIQGNIDRGQYNTHMEYQYKHFMKFLIDSRLDWDMSISAVSRIHFLIIEALSIYITRPIGDAERRSSRNRQDLFPEKKTGFIDKIANKYKKDNGRI